MIYATETFVLLKMPTPTNASLFKGFAYNLSTFFSVISEKPNALRFAVYYGNPS